MFVIYSISTLILAYPFFHMISKKMKVDYFTFNIFFIIKFTYLLLYIYSHYNNFGTDAIGYFNKAYKFSFENLLISDNFIYGINYFFKNNFYINFESLNVITFFISFLSCLLLLSLIKDVENSKKLGIYLILLYPSLNFFTSGLNKDMLIFFGLSLFLYSLFKKKNFLLIFSILLIFLVRPYVCLSIFLAIITCSSIFFIKRALIDRKVKFSHFVFYLVSTTIALILLHYILDNLLGSFGKYFLKGNFQQIIDNLQSHYTNTPLGIPVNTSIFLRLFDYIFFPALWHLPDYNLFFLILIVENTLLIIIIINCFYGFKFQNFQTYIALFSFLILFLILAVVTSNHGIALRQKWMILPFLIITISLKSK